MSTSFKLECDFSPAGDQPLAIEKLVSGITEGLEKQTLLGVTGSGKTNVMAWAIEKLNRPALIISPNKTLAAQLAAEFKQLFPSNAVNYFVSFYDYYTPEAYIPQSDTYIEKDSSRNQEIDRMRHAATTALLTRRDVIVVASVSCIYGIGSPEDYLGESLTLTVGEKLRRDILLRKLTTLLYERNDFELARLRFRVRGDVIDIVPANAEDVFRIELFGDEIEKIVRLDGITGEILESCRNIQIFPASHHVTSQAKMNLALADIKNELEERLKELEASNSLLEAQRLAQRTRFDIEMLEESGTCAGVENYSRHFGRRQPGDPPSTLIDYLPSDTIVWVDESHVTIPQIGGMVGGDHSRKQSLVDYGFRLPSAYDNRPLTFYEWEEKVNQVVYVSATPSDYEIEESKQIVEMLVRPTGLVDPEIEIRPTQGQVDDIIEEIHKRVAKNQRVLITALTKSFSEDLSTYLQEAGVRARYLHSDLDSMERIHVLHDLRSGEFDVLVGINLLREGLDLPEVGLVVILDADKEGFLRSFRSFIQIMGRAARNLDGHVIMYADRTTDSMRRAIDESQRRRNVQLQYNQIHGITPQGIAKAIYQIELGEFEQAAEAATLLAPGLERGELETLIKDLEREMKRLAKDLAFEDAAKVRDRISSLKAKLDDFS